MFELISKYIKNILGSNLVTICRISPSAFISLLLSEDLLEMGPSLGSK